MNRREKTWLVLLNLTLAVVAGAWLPVRMVFFGDMPLVDLICDVAFVCVLFGPRMLKVGFAAVANGGAAKVSERTWFEKTIPMVLNILAGLPLVSLLGALGYTDISSLFLLKLIVLRKFSSIRDLLDGLDSLHPIFARLLPLAFVVPTVVHVISCGWVWLGSGTAGPSDDKWFEYGRAAYWCITTLSTVGYGDISAKTLPQMAFAGMTMIIGVAFFGYVLSNVASLLARLDAAREAHTSMLDQVESYMRHNDLPVETRSKIRGYFRYLWESRRGYDDSTVLGLLPSKLRGEVTFFLNAGIIERVSFLKGADQDVVEDIVLQLRPQVFVPGEKVFHVGELGNAMYFIHHGSVEILSKDNKILATLGPGSFFGETALLTSNARNATARAVDYCDLYVLDREAFQGAVHRYPTFEKHMQEIVAERAKAA